MVLVNQSGSGFPDRADDLARDPDPRKTRTYATYQRAADWTFRKHESPERREDPQEGPTPPEARKPPSGIMESVGASRMSTWFHWRAREVARSREHEMIGRAARRGDEGHHTDRRAEREIQASPEPSIGRINTGIRTREALRARKVQSSSRRRADQRKARVT